MKEYIQFCGIALGSLNEVQVYFDLAKDLGYMSEQKYEDNYQELVFISKMLCSLIRKLDDKAAKEGKY